MLTPTAINPAMDSKAAANRTVLACVRIVTDLLSFTRRVRQAWK